MGQGKSSSAPRGKRTVRIGKEEREVLKKIYRSLLVRSASDSGLDSRAFFDFLSIPPLWQEKTFAICDTNHDGYLSFDDFANFASIMSFTDEESVVDFVYQLCDMDGDGKIDSENMRLFLASLPDELVLVVDESAKDRDQTVKLQFERTVEDDSNVLHVRGCNYETVTQQLHVVAETIVSSHPSSDKSTEAMDYVSFTAWIRQNWAVLEYLSEEVCPMQWLSYRTIREVSLQQSKSPRLDPVLAHLETNGQLLSLQQQSVSSLFYDTDRSVSPMISEEKAEHNNLAIPSVAVATSTVIVTGTETLTPPRRKSQSVVCQCTLCCFGCKRSKNAQKEIYPFEKGYRKKGTLQLQDSGKLTTILALCKYKCLYILSPSRKLHIKEAIALRGCYACTIPPLKAGHLVLHGFQLTVGEPGKKNSRSYQFFSQTKSEVQEWTQTIQEAISKDYGAEQWLQTNEQIGVGRFSKVFSGVDKRDGKPSALKIVNKSALNEIELEMLRKELAIVPHVQHPNILRFRSIYQTSHYAYIVGELVRGGELYSLIMKQTMSEEQAALVVYYLLEAIRYLHSCGIVHRDIKPENVLVETARQAGEDKIVNVKLIDFGFARVVLPNQVLMEQCGTLSYVAPEVLLKHGYGKEVDLWSLGVVMHLMLRGKLPFDSRERTAIVDRTIYADIDFSEEPWRHVSLSAKDLLKRLLEKNPSARIKTEEALCHPWILEKVKIKAIAAKSSLYPTIGPKEKQRCEDLLERVREKLPEKFEPVVQPIKAFISQQ